LHSSQLAADKFDVTKCAITEWCARFGTTGWFERDIDFAVPAEEFRETGSHRLRTVNRQLVCSADKASGASFLDDATTYVSGMS
jgi:hypothetical protein